MPRTKKTVQEEPLKEKKAVKRSQQDNAKLNPVKPSTTKSPVKKPSSSRKESPSKRVPKQTDAKTKQSPVTANPDPGTAKESKQFPGYLMRSVAGEQVGVKYTTERSFVAIYDPDGPVGKLTYSCFDINGEVFAYRVSFKNKRLSSVLSELTEIETESIKDHREPEPEPKKKPQKRGRL